MNRNASYRLKSGRFDGGSLFMKATQGFTLPELVAVIVITGILAGVALPRFMSRTDFDVFGFAEQTAGMIRYAQKTAIAKRRYTCVQGTSTQLAVRFDPAANGTQPCTSSSYVLNPAGTQRDTGQNYIIRIPSGVSIASSSGAATIVFDTQGRPVGLSNTLTITLAGGGVTRAIRVEPETGYVR